MRQLFVILFFISSYLAMGKSPLLDSLYKVLNSHPQHDTARVGILFEICKEEYNCHLEKYKTLADEALKISKEIHFGKGEGKAYNVLAYYYYAEGNFEQAIKYTYQLLAISERISYSKGITYAYNLLGIINQELKDYEKAKVFFKKALQRSLKEDVKRDIGYYYGRLGSLYYDLSQFDTALILYQKSFEIRKKINDEYGLGDTYLSLAYTYLKQKKYTQALVYLENSLLINQKLNNFHQLAYTYDGLGEVYLLTDDYQKAELYLLKAVTLAKNLNLKKLLQEDYHKLTLLEKKRNRFETALSYFELETNYRDSIYTEDKAKKIAEIETRYETQKKDQQIQLLERDKHIRVLWTNILIAAFILLAITFVVIYHLQRYRERKNRQILNLEIEQLTTQHEEFSEKCKNLLIGVNEYPIDSHEQRLLKKAIEVVENNMSDSLFSVEKMAEEMGMSRTNMHRKIKAITGFPPGELIRTIRLRKAAILLLNQTDSVSQISFAVGFEDQSYFSKSFKKQFGVTPSEYLKSKNQVENEVSEIG